MFDHLFNILRKTLVGTVTIIFAFVIVYTPQDFNNVKQTEAFIGAPQAVFEIGANLAANTVTAGVTTADAVRENVLNGIAWSIGKAIVSSLVTSMVDWINSGFKGSPAFITDLEKFLLEAADRAAGEFIASLGEEGSFLCSPFKLDIQIALSLKYQTRRAGKPYEGCKLSDIVDNIEDFLDGTFTKNRKSGWNNWFKITSQPEKYTPYGQMLTAETELNARLINKKGQELNKVNWGQGFISGEICKAIEKPEGGSKKKCVISKPGTVIASSINKALGAGQDALVTADEINEIISALIGQIANKAITGAAGLLGLSVGTGYTYPGFNGGSYTSAANAQASNQINGSYGLEIITTSLKVQEDYKKLTNEVIPKFRAYLADPKNSEENKQIVTAYMTVALSVQALLPEYITKLTAMLESYKKLQTEIDNPNTTTDRKVALQKEQAAIINSATSLGAYNQSQLDASKESWKIPTTP